MPDVFLPCLNKDDNDDDDDDDDDDDGHGFSHDLTKIQTTKLLILLRFYFHDV